jgi:hypothetical protein
MIQKLYKAVIESKGNEGDDLMGFFQNHWVLADHIKKDSAVKFFHHPCLSS